MRKLYKIAALGVCAMLTTTACTRDTAGKLRFDSAKACRAVILAAGSIDEARKIATDAGAKPSKVNQAANVAVDVAAFAAAICGAAAT